MGVLVKKKALQEKNTRKQHGRIPRYRKDGTVRYRWKIIPMTISIVILLIGFTIAAIHIPVLLYNPQPRERETEKLLKADETGVKNMIEYAKDHPNEDFDNDGLINADEVTYATDPRDPDSDGDGISDYAEIYLYNSRPGEKDGNLTKVVQLMLEERGIKYSTPYKIHDVILWPDDLESRSAGTVVPTLRGYRFVQFNGWAQFPYDVYAYQIVNGIHEPLEYRKQENVWRIQSKNADKEVLIYGDQLMTTNLLTLFDRKYYVQDGLLATILSYVLPKEHSFITFKQIVWQDTYDIDVEATVTGTTMPDYDPNNLSRFGTNTIEFESLTEVYSSILAGKAVIISLQSPSYGEVICLAYGYTEFGDLLIASTDGTTTNEKGDPYILDVIEKAAITIDQNGDMRQREYFDFIGLGFDSTRGDKIHFLMKE